MLVDENTRPLPIHAIIGRDPLHTQMKSALIFKTDRDPAVEGKANPSSNLMQPVFQVLLSGFTPGKPAIQPRRSGDCNPVSH
jgi:hypothetical protein